MVKVVGPVRVKVILPSPHAILSVPESTVTRSVKTDWMPLSEPVGRVEFDSLEVVGAPRELERLDDANKGANDG